MFVTAAISIECVKLVENQLSLITLSLDSITYLL